MSILSRLKAVQPLVLVLFLAVFLRAWAVALLPQDFDEPIYLQNAFDYAELFRSADPIAALDYPGTSEHPAFVKLIYSSVVLVLGDSATWTGAYYMCRAISALFGVLAVAFVGLSIDPLAAGMLAIHTLAVKYTSQVYLEAIPHAMTIASVLCLLRYKTKEAKTGMNAPDRWFWMSAIALGVATASKFTYIPVVAIVLGYIALFDKKINLKYLVLYGLAALVVFFLLDIYLWPDPLNRLLDSSLFHLGYSQSQHVEDVGYPWFQPFIWILTSPPGLWHPNVFFYYGLDGIITILALIGVKRERKERRWLVVWLTTGIAFLLLWPTKWPQYALIITPALCIMGAETLRRGLAWARAQDTYWGYMKTMFPKPGKWFWAALLGFLLFIMGIYLSSAAKLAVGRIGWSSIAPSNSFLPNNSIHVLLPISDIQMMIGTDGGVAIWEEPPSADSEPIWTIYTVSNSGLMNNSVQSISQDSNGDYWFGTPEGISRFDGETWRTIRPADMGLTNAFTVSLASDSVGHVFAGTLVGGLIWDGSTWFPVEQTTGQAVFCITVTQSQVVWFGLPTGAGRLDLATGGWEFHPTDAAVKHILVDSRGTIWAATSGAGLASFSEDGSAWTYYRTSNSGIPFNTVNWVTEAQPGILWVGTAHPTTAGGAVASFDGTTWHAYLTSDSGASGAEVTVIDFMEGQIWMGTRTKGIDIFQVRRK